MKRALPLVLFVVAGIAHGGGDDWLTRASKAVRSTDYRGTLVYLRDGKMDTLRIVHRYRDGRERERMVSLSGEPREVIRDDDMVTCVLPAKRMVLVAHHPLRSLLANVAGASPQVLAENYRIRDLGERRLADRMCRAIAIEPKDDYRYGYRLLIDRETHLPLKLDLLHGDQVLEQMMFTDIDFPADIPDAAFKPTFETRGFRWVRHQPADGGVAAAEESAWRVGDLPPGFKLADVGMRRVGGHTMARQLLFTDGIATVSAFIASGTADRRSFAGTTTMGAVNAFGRMLDGHQITVVGEVPEVTVRHIAEQIRRKSAAPAAGP